MTGARPLHVHLDPVGGIAGDMFAAAMLDAFPALGEGLIDALHRAGLANDVTVRWEPVTDRVLAGMRFVVDDPRERRPRRPPHSAVFTRESAAAHAGHAHVPFVDIRRRIAESALPPPVIARALDIFTSLARAEASVHGFGDVDAVVLHEVGAQDSVADIVAAAWLIEHARVTSWSTAPVPLGSGLVKTAHGMLPVPAPATVALLQDIATHDDGLTGERVTPTGAAILKHVVGAAGPRAARRPSGTLGRAGIGWGTKQFPTLPNVLRVLPIELGERRLQLGRDEVSVLSFDVDDQPAEDLAVALEHIRALPGVVDAQQSVAYGKKSRLVTAVRVLARVDAGSAAEDDVIRACLTETTTLGVRIERVQRAILERAETERAGVRVKRVTRPDGAVTAKADIDDVAELTSAHARDAARRKAERRDGEPDE